MVCTNYFIEYMVKYAFSSKIILTSFFCVNPLCSEFPKLNLRIMCELYSATAAPSLVAFIRNQFDDVKVTGDQTINYCLDVGSRSLMNAVGFLWYLRRWLLPVLGPLEQKNPSNSRLRCRAR